MAGMAHPLLKHAFERDINGLKQQIVKLILELKTAMFLTKSSSIEELRIVEKIIQGKTRDWLTSD